MADPISLLPEENATPAMRAQSLTSAERRPIPVDLLATLWDPSRAPVARLPSLAADLSVDLWDEEWPEVKKRAVVAQSPELHRLKGTLEGIRRHMAIEDGVLVEALAPPQHFFISPDLTKEQWQGWLNRLPQIRIYLAAFEGEAGAALFFEDGFYDADFLEANDGRALYGRFGTYYRNGVETPIRTIDRFSTSIERLAVDIERYEVPGSAPDALCLDVDAWDSSRYFNAEAVLPQTYTVRHDRTYLDTVSDIRATTAEPSLDPIDVRSQRVSAVGVAGPAIMLNGDFWDAGSFYLPDEGARLLHDRLYLHDRDVLAPLTDAVSFFDVSRFSIAPFTAELLVKAPAPLAADSLIFDVTHFDDAFLITPDHTALDRVMDAVVVSKAHRDSVSISFAVTRPRTFADGIPLDGSFSFGDRVANNL